MNKRIAIIDDEPDMVRIATDLLEPEGYVVTSSTHPEEGLKKIRQSQPDLLLLDIRMPDKDGFEVLRELKGDVRTKGFPVVMISVKTDEADVVVGLELGAEDYISKPFRKRELLARVKALLRRTSGVPEPQRLDVGGICVDYGSYTATIGKKQLPLTPKEFELLGHFLKMQGRILTRAAICEAVWGFEFTGTSRTIDVHVDQLRHKLGKHAACIISLKGVGYRFEPEE